MEVLAPFLLDSSRRWRLVAGLYSPPGQQRRLKSWDGGDVEARSEDVLSQGSSGGVSGGGLGREAQKMSPKELHEYLAGGVGSVRGVDPAAGSAARSVVEMGSQRNIAVAGVGEVPEQVLPSRGPEGKTRRTTYPTENDDPHPN